MLLSFVETKLFGKCSAKGEKIKWTSMIEIPFNAIKIQYLSYKMMYQICLFMTKIQSDIQAI
jgi:hypothetical protein